MDRKIVMILFDDPEVRQIWDQSQRNDQGSVEKIITLPNGGELELIIPEDNQTFEKYVGKIDYLIYLNSKSRLDNTPQLFARLKNTPMIIFDATKNQNNVLYIKQKLKLGWKIDYVSLESPTDYKSVKSHLEGIVDKFYPKTKEMASTSQTRKTLKITLLCKNRVLHEIVGRYIRVDIESNITFGDIADIISKTIGYNVTIGRQCGDDFKDFNPKTNAYEYITRKVYREHEICIFEFFLNQSELMRFQRTQNYAP